MLNRKSFLLALIFTSFVCFFSFSQTANYNSSVNLITIPVDSLTTEQKIQLTINFTEIDSIGGLAYSIHDINDGSLIYELKSTISELQTQGFINSSQFIKPVFPFQNGINVRIDIIPIDLEGNYLEHQEIITNF